MRPGDKAIWLHQLRGGYGYVERIPVTIVKLGRERVQVEAPLKNGGTKLVWVSPETLLRPRN